MISATILIIIAPAIFGLFILPFLEEMLAQSARKEIEENSTLKTNGVATQLLMLEIQGWERQHVSVISYPITQTIILKRAA